jgi:hypothetical protein
MLVHSSDAVDRLLKDMLRSGLILTVDHGPDDLAVYRFEPSSLTQRTDTEALHLRPAIREAVWDAYAAYWISELAGLRGLYTSATVRGDLAARAHWDTFNSHYEYLFRCACPGQ